MTMQQQTINPNEGKSELSELISNSYVTKSRTAHGDLKRKHVKEQVLKLFNIQNRDDL